MSPRTAIRFLDRTTPPHIVTLVLMAGLAAMNMAVFLPSLPVMADEFGTSYGVMQLSVSLYLAATAVLQLAIGPLSDRYGRRPVTLAGIAIFLGATVGCLLAPTVEVFLTFRILQAAVATGMVLSRAIVRDLYATDESASVIGYVTMGMALVPMIAPMIGGALDQAFGWRAVFVFLILTGAVIGAVIWADQGETAAGGGRPFREQLHDYPELLLSRRFWGYVATAAFASGAFFAFLGGAPLVATEVYGLSPFEAGIAFGAPAVGYAVGNGIAGRYSMRLGIDRLILVGCVVALTGLSAIALLVLLGLDSASLVFALFVTLGLGNGMVIPTSTAGMLSVRPSLAGTASGLGAAFMIGGGAALSALAGVVLEGSRTGMPLFLLMVASSLAALASIIYVRLRARHLARTGGLPDSQGVA